MAKSKNIIFTKKQAEDFRSIPSLEEGADNPVEFTVSAWLKAQLASFLPKEGIVCDVGCGNGRLFSSLEGDERILFGVDNSQAMLEQLPQPYRASLTDSFVRAEKELLAGHDIVLCGDCLQDFPKLARTNVRFGAALASFAAPCFEDPGAMIGALMPLMATGARLFLVSNVFVDAGLVPQRLTFMGAGGFEGDVIDIHDPSLARLGPPRGIRFCQILHMKGLDITLKDFAHNLAMYDQAFDPSRWRVQEARLFPADGCEHISAQACLFDADRDRAAFLEPDRSFAYVKIGIIAQRLG
jgi:SAM-dependent methyltransferase